MAFVMSVLVEEEEAGAKTGSGGGNGIRDGYERVTDKGVVRAGGHCGGAFIFGTGGHRPSSKVVAAFPIDPLFG